MSRPFAGTIIRWHYIDRSSSGAPLREKALAIPANTCGPATTFWKRNDVHTPWAGAGHYAIYMKQAIQPMYECRNDMAIFADLAARLGIDGYDDRIEEQWLRELTKSAVDDFDSFRENGVARFAPPKDAVAFANQIRDPDTHKFTTPSGKIEIYSMAMAAKPDPYGLGAMPPIPTWFDPVEPDAKYPLMLCSPKSRARTHSIHGNQPLLARVDPDDVWMNPMDAKAREIVDGQTVRIFNDRGSILLPVKVTSRIAQGVVSIKEGTWFLPSVDEIDTGCCANVLAEDRSAPCGGDNVQYECHRSCWGVILPERVTCLPDLDAKARACTGWRLPAS